MGKSEQAIENSKSVNILKSKDASQREKQTAFNDLFTTHKRQLLLYFMKRLSGDTETSEDLVMVTFEKIHKNIKSFDDNYAFSTWMYKIAERSLIDHTRKDKHEVLSLEGLSSKTGEGNDGMELQIDAGVRDPEEEMAHSEAINQITEEIYSLENDFIRDLMVGRYIDDLSFAEIAEKMGVENNSTLRVNVNRGIKILKEKLV